TRPITTAEPPFGKGADACGLGRLSRAAGPFQRRVCAGGRWQRFFGPPLRLSDLRRAGMRLGGNGSGLVETDVVLEYPTMPAVIGVPAPAVTVGRGLDPRACRHHR